MTYSASTNVNTGPPRLVNEQLNLMLRVGTNYGRLANGRDLAFVCQAREGGLYYCKDDRNGRRVRATEWIVTNIAAHLGIATAPCAVLDDQDGQTYFGSRANPSTASESLMRSYFARRRVDEIGQPTEWLGRHLSRLHAVDLFFDNPDRHVGNFVLINDGQDARICAIDFGACELKSLATARFPSLDEATMKSGRAMRAYHGFHPNDALEIVSRLPLIPMDVIDRILQGVPDDWYNFEEKRGFRDAWLALGSGVRIPALRTGLTDGTLA